MTLGDFLVKDITTSSNGHGIRIKCISDILRCTEVFMKLNELRLSQRHQVTAVACSRYLLYMCQ